MVEYKNPSGQTISASATASLGATFMQWMFIAEKWFRILSLLLFSLLSSMLVHHPIVQFPPEILPCKTIQSETF